MNHKVRRRVTKATLTVLAISSLGNPIIAIAETIDFNGLSFNLLSNQAQPVEDTAAASFSFAQNRFIVTKNEVTTIPFQSTVEVNEVSFELPEHVDMREDDLPSNLKASKDQATNQWTLTAAEATKTFALPVVFATEGSFPITVGDGETTVDVRSTDTNSSSEQLQAVPENDAAPVVEGSEDLANRHAVLFDGSSRTVEDRRGFMEALSDQRVSKIILGKDINIQFIVSSENLDIQRPLIIDGQNQYTLNLGTAQLRLMNTTENKTLRLENIFLDKTDSAAYIISENAAENWELQLAGIAKSRSSIQNFRIATIPEATTRITDGTSMFASTVDLNGAFITTKEFIMENNAKMELSSVQHTGLAFTRENAKLTVTDGAHLHMKLDGRSAQQNAVQFTQQNATLVIQNGGKVDIQAEGSGLSTSNATLGNNIAMRGAYSLIEIDGGELVTTNTGGHNIIFDGDTSSLSVSNAGILKTQSGIGTSIHGGKDKNSLFFGTDATVEIVTNSGKGIHLLGRQSDIHIQDAKNVSVKSTSGDRITMSGSLPVLHFENSHVDLTSDTGAGIILLSNESEMIVDNSQLSVTNTGNLTNGMNQFDGEQSSLKIMNGSIVNMTGALTGTNVANGLLLFRKKDASIAITNESEVNLTVTNGSGKGVQVIQENATIEIKHAVVNVETNSGFAIDLNSDHAKIMLDNGQLHTTSNHAGQAVSLKGLEARLALDNESIMSVFSTESDKPNILIEGMKSGIDLSNHSKLSATLPSSDSTTSIDLTSKEVQKEHTSSDRNFIYVLGDKTSFNVSKGSSVDIDLTSGIKRGIRLQGDDASFELSEGADVRVATQSATAIQLNGNRVKMIAKNEGTRLTASSNYVASILNGVSTVKLGEEDEDIIAEKPIVDLSDGAMVEFSANSSSALVVQGLDGQLNVRSGANFSLEAEASGELPGETDYNDRNANATLRFMRSGVNNTGTTHGGYRFNIDGGVMSVTKNGGNPGGSGQMAPAIRMWGSDNQVKVSNGGRFLIVNEGSGIPHDGNAGGGNQGIHYTSGTKNGFTVTDPGSEVRIYADYGPALDMSEAKVAGTIGPASGSGEDGGDGRIEVNNLGYFEAIGRTESENAGIFRGKITEIYFNNPLFMNYRNNRVGGGNVFSNASGSILEAKSSDFAVWKKGADLDGDPHLAYSNLDYTFTGSNLAVLSSIEPQDGFDFEVFGQSGMASYARLSSNNARWSILTELRVPTNADKKIHGQVDMPVGIYDSRPAWQDEVKVTVEIERNGETIQTFETFTQGHTNERPGISIYGEAARGGLFEIELDDYLQAGDVVRVSDLEVMAGVIQDGFEHIFDVDEVTVFPIVPPTPATFAGATIPANAAVLTGTTDNPEVEITITHNGQPVTIDAIDVRGSDNQFAIPIDHLSLSVGDEIQVFLRDQHGSALRAGVVAPPITNNNIGNINPVETLDFRDAAFPPATTLIVGEMVEGELTIDRATNWDFGQHPLTSRATTYDALPFSTQAGEETATQANFVQITDARATSEISSWSLYVSQRNQFSSTNDTDNQELTGAQLSWKNGRVHSSTGQSASENNFGIVRTSGKLLPGGDSIQLISTNMNSDKGTWYYSFGDETTKDSSISLEIPSGSKTRGARYTTTINYSFNAVPPDCVE